MREALAALSAMGYISSMIGVGTVVSHPSFDNLIQPFVRLLAQKTVSADEFSVAAAALSAAQSEQPNNRVIAIIHQICYALATDQNTNAGNTMLLTTS
jgi:DNA-binding FadR family transcriptional regulator